MKTTIFPFSRIIPRPQPLFLIGIILSVLLCACGPNKKYVGPYLPDKEIAIIQPGDKMFTHVDIISLDKNMLYTGESSISVHPGKHTLFLEAVLDYPFLDKYLYFNQYLTFQTEAGRIYTLHASILPMRNEGFTWITSDLDPDEIIIKKYAVDLIPLSSYP